MPTITEIEDLKRIYKRRVPKMFYDYCESGSWTEQTFRDNVSDFNDLRLRPRVVLGLNAGLAAYECVSPKSGWLSPSLTSGAGQDLPRDGASVG